MASALVHSKLHLVQMHASWRRWRTRRAVSLQWLSRVFPENISKNSWQNRTYILIFMSPIKVRPIYRSIIGFQFFNSSVFCVPWMLFHGLNILRWPYPSRFTCARAKRRVVELFSRSLRPRACFCERGNCYSAKRLIGYSFSLFSKFFWNKYE